jgi:predicted RNase H-like HicB family nuclease
MATTLRIRRIFLVASPPATRDQAARNMHAAIEMHVRGLVEDNLPVPQAHSFAEYIAIPA